MAYYTHSTPKSQVKSTWLHFSFVRNITDTLGETLPYPQKHYHNEDGTIVYCWLIDGFFDTKKGNEYLNDIIARVLLTYPSNAKYIKHYTDSKASISPYKLKQFQGLVSRVEKRKEYHRADVTHDYIFWVLKYYAEDLIREDGFIIHDKLLSFALDNFIDKAKDKSTLKAKCRSIYYWYFDRDWEIGRSSRKYETKEELMASRKKHMENINTKRVEETRTKVVNCITGLYAFEYKKPNGNWNVTKIAKDTSLSRDSVYKYIKEFEESSNN